MADRPSRRSASKAEKQNELIKSLANRTRKTVEEETNAPVFVEVTEKEYAAMQRKRGKEFVVEDDGLGYAETGEEDWTRENDDDYEEEEEVSKKGKRGSSGGAGGGAAKKAKNPAAALENTAGMKKITEMMAAPPTSLKRKTGPADNGAFLNDLLGNFDAKSMMAKKIAPSNARPNNNAGRAGGGGGMGGGGGGGGVKGLPRGPLSVPGIGMKVKKEESSQQQFDYDDNHADMFLPDDDGGGAPAAAAASSSSASKHSVSFDADVDMDRKPTLSANNFARIEKVPSASSSSGGYTAAAVAASLGKQDGEDEEETTEVGQSWRALADPSSQEMSGSQQDEAMEDVAASNEAAATLPLADDGSLEMFWLDAVEEPSHPGRIYLFGKVVVPPTDPKSKEKKFASCCCVIEQIQRTIYVLPREKFVDDDGNEVKVNAALVSQELTTIARQKGVRADIRIKKDTTTRRFLNAFERNDVPYEAGYFKAKYAPEAPALPPDVSGRTFSHVFNTSATFIESLLLKRKMKGPGWVRIKNVRRTPAPLSWCKYECTTPTYKSIEVIDDHRLPPALVVASLHMRTMVGAGNSNEIVMASLLIHPEVSVEGATVKPESKFRSYNVIRKLPTTAFPMDFQKTLETEYKNLNVDVANNERALLNRLLTKIHSLDPDVLVGHNIMGFDLAVILQRCQAQNVVLWAKLGRLRRSQMPKLKSQLAQNTWAQKMAASGRLVCDTYLSAKEFLPKETTYTLSQLSKTQLRKKRIEPPEDLPSVFLNSSQLINTIKCTENDSYLSLQLMFKLMVIPLSFTLTTTAGNLWSRSLLGARAERVEYHLLHSFYAQKPKFIFPDRAAVRDEKKGGKQSIEKEEEAVGDEDEDGGGEEEVVPAGRGGRGGAAAGGGGAAAKKGRRKPAYAGGLVLEPKRGLYNHYVLLLDFNSLYPSIIQEYNICFTTVTFPGKDDEGNVKPYEFPPREPKAPLPQVIRGLVDRRRAVKREMANEQNPERHQQLDIRQQALKILANSMYGCLGFSSSRFYAKPLAEMITAQGREALQKSVNIAQNQLKLEVIYGDTDSIMINSGVDDLKEAKAIANNAKTTINKMFTHLEIDLDGLFCPMLLLQKKKYAAVTISESNGEIRKKTEKKGLDMVRRDWCPLSKNLGESILSYILQTDGQTRTREEVVSEIHDRLRTVANQLAEMKIPIQDFVITKGLTRNPEDYPDGSQQPHVQVALEMKARGMPVAPGMHIPFVVCEATEGGANTSLAKRAHHPDALKRDPTLKLDIKWYLSQQLHPPVSRLCAVIEGTDASRLAECLGLDPSRYHHRSQVTRDDGPINLNDEDAFKDCRRLVVVCPSCNQQTEFEGVYRYLTTGSVISGLLCNSTECSTKADRGEVRVRALSAAALAIKRESLGRFHDFWMHCSDATCGMRTKSMRIADFHSGEAVREAGRCCVRSGCQGRMEQEYTCATLRLQLEYLRRCFSFKEAQRRLESVNKLRQAKGMPRLTAPFISPATLEIFSHLESDIEATLDASSYNVVDPSRVFFM